MAVIRSTDHPELLDIPLNEVFQNWMSEISPEYQMWINVESTDVAFEDSLKIGEFGNIPLKNEGALFQFENIQSSDTKRINLVEAGLGYIITRKMRDDDRHGVMVKLTQTLRRSFRHFYEVRAFRILNNSTATSAEFLGLDGKPLLAVDHPLMGGGTQSNRLAGDGDLTATNVEAGVLNFHARKGETGQPRIFTPKMAIFGGQYQYRGAEIFRNAMAFGTANNNENWIKQGPDSNGISNYLAARYLADSTAWFLATDKSQHDAVLRVRVSPEFQVGSDFRTDNYLARGYCRLGEGFFNYHQWFGSLGTGG